MVVEDRCTAPRSKLGWEKKRARDAQRARGRNANGIRGGKGPKGGKGCGKGGKGKGSKDGKGFGEDAGSMVTSGTAPTGAGAMDTSDPSGPTIPPDMLAGIVRDAWRLVPPGSRQRILADAVETVRWARTTYPGSFDGDDDATVLEKVRAIEQGIDIAEVVVRDPQARWADQFDSEPDWD